MTKPRYVRIDPAALLALLDRSPIGAVDLTPYRRLATAAANATPPMALFLERDELDRLKPKTPAATHDQQHDLS